MVTESYLKDSRKNILIDEHTWYIHLLILFLIKDYISYAWIGLIGVFVWGGVFVLYSYLKHWEWEDQWFKKREELYQLKVNALKIKVKNEDLDPKEIELLERELELNG